MQGQQRCAQRAQDRTKGSSLPHVVAAADLGAAGVGVAGGDVQGVVLCEGRGIELVHEKQRGMLRLGEMECNPFDCHSRGNLRSRPTPAALTGDAREQDLGVLLVELGVAAGREGRADRA